MNTTGKVIVGLVLGLALIIGVFWAVDLSVTDEGELPSADVSIDVDPGRLPSVDVDTVDIDVGTRQEEVVVPNVRVTLEEETITVPTISIDPPDAGAPGEDTQTR